MWEDVKTWYAKQGRWLFLAVFLCTVMIFVVIKCIA
jgi:predicted negative regulator of RcsB-dependent stress response